MSLSRTPSARRSSLVLSTLLSALILGASAPAIAATHWDYGGHVGAEHWGEIDPAFAECSMGHRQSPVNIDKTVKADLPPLVFHYGTAAPTIWNNGHTVQVNLPAGHTLEVGEQRYELLQFHFHTPSEERIHGQAAPMVAHFVHRNAAGELGVVAVLMRAGASNASLRAVFQHLPHPGEHITVDDLSLDLTALLPQSLGYYDFTGSLTTPPCSEGVHWMVLKEPVTLSSGQLATFRKLIGHNARPVQPLHGREVLESR